MGKSVSDFVHGVQVLSIDESIFVGVHQLDEVPLKDNTVRSNTEKQVPHVGLVLLVFAEEFHCRHLFLLSHFQFLAESSDFLNVLVVEVFVTKNLILAPLITTVEAVSGEVGVSKQFLLVLVPLEQLAVGELEDTEKELLVLEEEGDLLRRESVLLEQLLREEELLPQVLELKRGVGVQNNFDEQSKRFKGTSVNFGSEGLGDLPAAEEVSFITVNSFYLGDLRGGCCWSWALLGEEVLLLQRGGFGARLSDVGEVQDGLFDVFEVDGEHQGIQVALSGGESGPDLRKMNSLFEFVGVVAERNIRWADGRSLVRVEQRVTIRRMVPGQLQRFEFLFSLEQVFGEERLLIVNRTLRGSTGKVQSC